MSKKFIKNAKSVILSENHEQLTVVSFASESDHIGGEFLINCDVV